MEETSENVAVMNPMVFLDMDHGHGRHGKIPRFPKLFLEFGVKFRRGVWQDNPNWGQLAASLKHRSKKNSQSTLNN